MVTATGLPVKVSMLVVMVCTNCRHHNLRVTMQSLLPVCVPGFQGNRCDKSGSPHEIMETKCKTTCRSKPNCIPRSGRGHSCFMPHCKLKPHQGISTGHPHHIKASALVIAIQSYPQYQSQDTASDATTYQFRCDWQLWASMVAR